MTNVTRKQFDEKLRITYLLIIVIFLVVIDYIVEFYMGSTWRQILFDSFLEVPRVMILLYAISYTWNLLSEEKKRKSLLEKSLYSTQQEASMWQEKTQMILSEFEKLVSKQFNSWSLSKSEQEVALLMMRGKSTKDIAQLRYTSDRTIRNQCRSIYEKSGLSGRNELAAFFLEQVLPKKVISS